MSWKIDTIDFESFGVYVSKSSGVFDMPRMVDKSINWLDENGKDVWQAVEDVKYEDREIVLSCWIKAAGYEEFKTKATAFFSALTAAGVRSLETPFGNTIEVSLQSSVQVVRKTSYVSSLQLGMFTLRLTVSGDDRRKYFSVFSNGEWITVPYSDGSLKQSVQGIPEITFSTESNSKKDFGAGDYLIFNGEKYVSFDTPPEDQLSSNKYRYKLAFKHQFNYLDDVQFRILGLSNTSLQSTAGEIIDLLITNTERRHPGLFVKGTVAITENRLHTFENESCLSVLTKTAKDYELEWDFKTLENGKIQINVKQSIDTPTGLTFEYGKDKELYRVSRPAYSRENICTHLYAYGSDKNLPLSYGYPCLKLPVEPIVFPSYDGDPVERTKVFDIKPERTGEVTSYTPGTPFEIVDASMDFDLKEVDGSGNTKWLINGQSAKLVFISGDLAGFEFEVQDYIHATKTFKLLPYTDETGASYPTEVLFPTAGDEYKILNINVPDSYVTDAENRLSVVANAWLNDLMTKSMPNEVETKPRSTYQALKPGNLVTLKHTGSGIEKTSRISEISTNLMNFISVITLSNTVNTPLLAQISNNISKIESSVAAVKAGISKYWQKTELVNDADNYLSVGGAKTKAGHADNSGLLNNLPDTKFLRKDIDQEVAAKTAWKDLITALFGFKAGIAGNTYLEMISELVALKKSMGTEAFQAGFAGSGWRMDLEDNRLTVDNLTVRKSMEVYELIINQIRATNGALWVSDAAKISQVMDGGSYWKCFIDTDGGNNLPPFVANDWVRCQKWTGRGIKYYSAKVTSVGADYFNITKTGVDGSDIPAAGDSVVRIGNATDASRQGAIYLTSSDNNSPYLDVLDGVSSPNLQGKTKVRLGKLNGINDPDFGELDGYGLFGENVYIKGKIQVTGGNAETKDGAQTKADAAQEAAAADATAKVNAIQIGGRNLFPNSSFENGAHIQLDANSTIFTAPFDDQLLAKQGNKVLYLSRFAEDSYWYFDAVEIEPNTIYTMSYWYMSAGAITNHSSFSFLEDENSEFIDYVGSGQNPAWTDKKWTLHKFTFTTPSNAKYFYFRFGFRSTDVAWAALDCLKLEIGNKATDWTPAPEDVIADAQAKADTAQAAAQEYALAKANLAEVNAKAHADGIVTAEEQRAINDATAKANAAQTAAVAAAALDATAKANAAKAAAQEYALAKANLAEVNAKAHADGIVTAEEQRAINDATAKANAAQTAAVAAAALDATAKANAIQVGGRNLLRNSDSAILPVYVIDADNYVYFNDKTCYLLAGVNYILKGKAPSGLGWSDVHGEVGSNNALLWLNGENGSHHIISNSSTGTVGTIFSVPTSQSYKLRLNVYKAGQYTFSKIKIEIGNKATDWTAAPEDIDAKIAEANYLKTALKGTTKVQGGLVATNVLLMEDAAGATKGGMSGIANDNVGVWTGGTYAEAIASTAKNILFKNGSFRLANGDVVYDINQMALTISALIRTAATGERVEISKESNSITIYDANNVARMKFAPKNVMAFADITGNVVTTTTTYSAHSNSVQGPGYATLGSSELLVLDPTKYYDITTPEVNYDLYALGYYNSQTELREEGSASVMISLFDTIRNVVVWTKTESIVSIISTPKTKTAKILSDTIVSLAGSTYRIDVSIYADTNEGVWSEASASASIAAGQTLTGTTMINFSEMGFNGFNFINDNQHFLHYGPDIFAYKGAMNIPGVLASGSVTAGAAHLNTWGAKVATGTQGVSMGGTGVFNIPHNLGSTAFTIMATPTTDNIICRVSSKSTNSFQVTCKNMAGVLTNSGFDYVMIGSN